MKHIKFAGLCNKKDLLKELKTHRKKGFKYIGRTKGYTLENQIQIVSFPLNKKDYGTIIKWK